MMVHRSDTSTTDALEREIADLWADGFDSFDIAASLSGRSDLNPDGVAITEAMVCRVLNQQRGKRRNLRFAAVRGS